MLKKKTRVSFDPSPSTSFLSGEEIRARFKHRCLLQDYHELLKETEGKRDRLNKALQKKLKLLAEVKFLTRKYQSFTNIPRVLVKPCRAGKQTCKEVTHPSYPVIETRPNLKERNLKSKQVSAQNSSKLADFNPFKVPLKERNHNTKEASVRNVPKLIDLNQKGEEMEAEVKREPLKIEKLKRSLVAGDEMADDIKFAVCRDMGGSNSGWGTAKFHGKISSL
ncbi:uncharacterized protein LOC110023440 [Phalaenopsis equestris]|uniref:uncharacterized protein LOC110023440 n=1 Tax=Phalaenopsis equestris TaxID=78828 RepID=UPI0009E3B188|nr:uncharacterized protein LOC110023440 [Phalaenopsis equestris]